MSWLSAAVRELLGLFVEDRALVLAIILWLAIDGLVLPRLGLDPRAVSLLLFAGAAAVLIGSTTRAARRLAPRATTTTADNSDRTE